MELPDDIIKYIFTFLNNKHKIKILPFVCKLFNKYTYDPSSWCKQFSISFNESFVENKKIKKILTECKFDSVSCFVRTPLLPREYFLLCKKITMYDTDKKFISDEHINKLSESKTLIELTLKYCTGLTNKCIPMLLKIKTLEKINLHQCTSITNQGLHELASMPLKELIINDYNKSHSISYAKNMNISNLETIFFTSKREDDKKYLDEFVNRIQTKNLIQNVYLNYVGDEDTLLKLSHLKLKKLELFGLKNITGHFVEHLNCENLNVLSLIRVDNIPEYLEQLLNKSTKLTDLYLDFNKIWDDDNLIEKNIDHLLPSFLNLVNLNQLALSSCIITNELFINLRNTQLQYLTLEECDIDGKYENMKDLKFLCNLTIDTATDEFLVYLKDLRIKDLNLCFSEINGSGLIYLINLPLKWLDLSYTDVIDEHLVHIKDHKLESLILCDCPNITSACLEFFKTMPLESLSIDHCDKVKEDAVEFFKKHYVNF
jgi:hypothetical protein